MGRPYAVPFFALQTPWPRPYPAARGVAGEGEAVPREMVDDAARRRKGEAVPRPYLRSRCRILNNC